MGPPGRGRARRSTSSHENPDYLPGIALPEHRARHRPTRPRRWTAPTSSCSPCRRRPCARTSSEWEPPAAARRVLVSLMKGIELGTTKRMSEVIAEVDRGGAGAHRRRLRARTSPRRSPSAQPAASVVACVDEAVAEQLQQVCHTAYFRPVHEHRRRRRRARRRGQERHRARRRDGRGHGVRRQLARPRSSPAASPRPPGSGSRSAPTPRRSPAWPGRRPGRDLHVAAVAQPHLRREPRHAACRWTEVVPATRQTAEGVKSCESDPGAGPRARRRHADHRARRRRRPRRACRRPRSCAA